MARTLIDLASCVSLDQLTRAWDDSVRRNLFDISARFLIGDNLDVRRAQVLQRANQLRALCVFDDKRMTYKTKVTDKQSWNDIPTCKEEGLDVQYLMLRAMFLPGKVTPEQQAFYVDLFQKVTQTDEYKDYMEKQALKPIFLTGNDMLKFLEEDDKLNASLMNEAGFVAK